MVNTASLKHTRMADRTTTRKTVLSCYLVISFLVFTALNFNIHSCCPFPEEVGHKKILKMFLLYLTVRSVFLV